MALTGSTNSERIFWYFIGCGMPIYGVCGLLANIDCESGSNPKNLEDIYEHKLGFTNESYTKAVDNGSYSGFVNDCAGYGLAQWTWWTRKQNLLNFAKSKQCSIGDLEMQLDFLKKELQDSYPAIWDILMNSKSIFETSNVVLLKFECPADQSVKVQNYRASVAQKYYDKYKNLPSEKDNNKNSEVIASMDYYVFQKGSKEKVAKNFHSGEFDCHGQNCCKETKINKKLVEYIQNIRDHFNSPINITSAYRCSLHNSAIGGANRSRHCAGDAADIVVVNHTPLEVARYAESIGILGIGLYETSSDGYFVHIDTRDYKSFWYGQAQSPRSTFGSSTANIPTGVHTTKKNLIKYGDSGDYVKSLQNDLIKLGYSCGVACADGSFGLGTKNAVIAFQKANNLTQDGIAGEITLNAIKKAIANLETKPYYATVTANLLNVRSGAGMNHQIVDRLPKGTVVVIETEKDGWGKIENGWVFMEYCQRKG